MSNKEKSWTREEQLNTLFQFFMECVRFWERELKTDSDLDKEPYIRALREVPTTNPYIPYNSPNIDNEVRTEFIKSRCMDTFGKGWEKEYIKIK